VTDISTTLIDRVRMAAHERTPLRITGNDSKSFMGRQPRGEPVSVTRHCGIVEYEPTELVISVRAGTTIRELSQVLAEHSQHLGCEPPESGGATVGGALACNQSGPSRPWAGSIRDHVLGVRLINGRGEHLRFGGRVMKNVAGYDVSRLQAGAMGCLGMITEVTFRVFPQLEHEATVAIGMSAAEAIDTMKREALRGGPLSAACWVDDCLYLRYSGGRSAVISRSSEVKASLLENGGTFWAKLREQQHGFFGGGEPLWRFSVKSGAGLGGERCLIDWGGALRWQRGGQEMSDQESLAERLGGQVSLYRGGDRDSEVFHSRTDAQKRIHKALKQAFDPHGIFNPGRLYSWL